MEKLINLFKCDREEKNKAKTLMDIIKEESVRAAVTQAGFDEEIVEIDAVELVDDGDRIWSVVSLHESDGNHYSRELEFTVYVDIRTNMVNGVFWTDGNEVV